MWVRTHHCPISFMDVNSPEKQQFYHICSQNQYIPATRLCTVVLLHIPKIYLLQSVWWMLRWSMLHFNSNYDDKPNMEDVWITAGPYKPKVE